MFLLNATKSCLNVRARELLVAGSVNVHQVKFEFSEDWADLTKTVTFKSLNESRSVILDEEGECVIPWEVLKSSSPYLYVGLIGTRDAEVVLPTIWADLGEVRNGATPGEDISDPTPTVYEQVLSELGNRANNLNVKDEKLQLRSGETVLSEVELPKQEAAEPGTTDHNELTNRDAADQHPIEAITGLADALKEAGSGGGVTAEEVDEKIAEAIEAIPNPSWNDLTDKPFGGEKAYDWVQVASATYNKGSDGASTGKWIITVPSFTPIVGNIYKVEIRNTMFGNSVMRAITAEAKRMTQYGTPYVLIGEEGSDLYCQTSLGNTSASYVSYTGTIQRHVSVVIYEEQVVGTNIVPLNPMYLPEGVVLEDKLFLLETALSDELNAFSEWIDGQFAGVISVDKAEIGQTIVVKAVDENGKPTEWEAADLPEGGAAIIDVVELPTENIEEDSFYRLLTGSFVVAQRYQNGWTCYCVKSLPEVGEPAANADLSIVTAYYNVTDGEVYAYVDDALSGVFGVPVGWYPAAMLFEAAGVEFGGVITDIMDCPVYGPYFLLLEYVIWQHKDGWTSLKKVGREGEGTNSVTFNTVKNAATGRYAFASGTDTTASGEVSNAEGGGTTASGGASHAEGNSTTASGDCSHAEGDQTTASGSYSHSEGHGTVASKDASHAEGWETTASSEGAHAEGRNTIASGFHSHAEGYKTTASGDTSHAEGWLTIARGSYQHAQGKWNLRDTEEKYAHIVGNGTETARSNAHTLDWSGLGWFAGGLKVGGTGQDDEASRTVMVNGDAQIVLTSPNGTKFAITVSDDGTLTATAQ